MQTSAAARPALVNTPASCSYDAAPVMHSIAAVIPLDSGCARSWRREDGQQPLLALHMHKRSMRVSRGRGDVGMLCETANMMVGMHRCTWVPRCVHLPSRCQHDSRWIELLLRAASMASSCPEPQCLALVMLGDGMAKCHDELQHVR